MNVLIKMLAVRNFSPRLLTYAIEYFLPFNHKYQPFTIVLTLQAHSTLSIPMR